MVVGRGIPIVPVSASALRGLRAERLLETNGPSVVEDPYCGIAIASFDESGKLGDSAVVAFGGCVLLKRVSSNGRKAKTGQGISGRIWQVPDCNVGEPVLDFGLVKVLGVRQMGFLALRISAVAGIVLGLCEGATVTIDSITPVSGTTVTIAGTTLVITGDVTNIDSNPQYIFGFGGSFTTCSCPAAFSIDPAASFMWAGDPFATGLPVGGSYAGPLFDLVGITTPLTNVGGNISFSAKDPFQPTFVQLFDNVKVNTVPEPNTASFLAAAAIALAFWRMRHLLRHCRKDTRAVSCAS